MKQILSNRTICVVVLFLSFLFHSFSAFSDMPVSALTMEQTRIQYELVRRRAPELLIKFYRLKNTDPHGLMNTISALKSDQGSAFLDPNTKRVIYLDRKENIDLISDIFLILEKVEAQNKTEFNSLYTRKFPDALVLRIFRVKNADLNAVDSTLNSLKSNLGRIQIDLHSKQVLIIDTEAHIYKMHDAILKIERESTPKSS